MRGGYRPGKTMLDNNILLVIYLQSRKGCENANKNLEVQEVQT
jgi:hypothetical protein